MGKEINVYVFLSTSVTWSFGPLGRLSDQVGHEGVCISAVSATHTVYASVPHPCPSLLPLTVTSVIVAFAVFLDPNPVVQPTVFTQRTDSEGAWCVLYHRSVREVHWYRAWLLRAHVLHHVQDHHHHYCTLTLQVCVKVGKDSSVKAN